MNETRPCLVKCEVHEPSGDHGAYQNVTVEKRAIFHRFADGTTYANDVEVPHTTALVEFEDGKLKKVEPDYIRFTDKPSAVAA